MEWLKQAPGQISSRNIPLLRNKCITATGHTLVLSRIMNFYPPSSTTFERHFSSPFLSQNTSLFLSLIEKTVRARDEAMATDDYEYRGTARDRCRISAGIGRDFH